MILVNVVYTIIDSFTDSANSVMDQIQSVFSDQQYDRAAAMSWVYFLKMCIRDSHKGH